MTQRAMSMGGYPIEVLTPQDGSGTAITTAQITDATTTGKQLLDRERGGGRAIGHRCQGGQLPAKSGGDQRRQRYRSADPGRQRRRRHQSATGVVIWPARSGEAMLFGNGWRSGRKTWQPGKRLRWAFWQGRPIRRECRWQ